MAKVIYRVFGEETNRLREEADPGKMSKPHKSKHRQKKCESGEEMMI